MEKFYSLTPVLIKRAVLQLPTEFIHDIQRSLVNERTLDEIWVRSREWQACYMENGELNRFVASALIRECRALGTNFLIAVDTVDAFRAMNNTLPARVVDVSMGGISQACYGLPEGMARLTSDFEWFLQKAFSPTLFFPGGLNLSFMMLRDASTCTTMAAPPDFVARVVRNSRRRWFAGIPIDGLKSADAMEL